jgi:hypothetical protein
MVPGSTRVAVAHSANPKDVHATLEKVLVSGPFRSSAQCQKLLTYIVRHTLAAEESSLRERAIGVQVFGRSPDYDSSNDAVVRMRVAEVRKRLAQFYQSPDFIPGMVRIEIPPGSYSAVFYPTQRESVTQTQRSPYLAPASVNPPSIAENRRSVPLTVALALFLIGVAGSWFVTSSFVSNTNRYPASNLRKFWRGFLTPADTPAIVFSSSDIPGVVKGDSTQEGRNSLDVGETGPLSTPGEVAGVFEVTRLLTSFQKTLHLNRGDLFSSDEARDSSLVLLGRSLVEKPFWDVPVLHDFQFRPAASASAYPPPWAIVNLHPRAGEANIYSGPERRPFQLDYAVVALKPGLTPNRVMLVLAGTSGFGTQAAGEFVTDERNVSALIARLGVKSDAELPWFEAVLRVGVSGGVPVRSTLVAVHRMP